MDDYNKRMKEWIAKMVKEELLESDDSDIEKRKLGKGGVKTQSGVV